jgi:hypothetical protein
MGNKSSCAQINGKFCDFNNKPLNGKNKVVYYEYTYKGNFNDGLFTKGEIFKNTLKIAEGEFNDNKLVKGIKQIKATSIFSNLLLFNDMKELEGFFYNLSDEYNLYILGQFKNNCATGICTVYYDVEMKYKCMSGNFDNNALIEGEIYLPDESNSLIEKGKYDTYEKGFRGLVDGFALRYTFVPGIDKIQPLYMRVNKYDRTLSNNINNFTGIAEYYYTPSLSKLAMKAEVVEDNINGDCIYYNRNGKLLFLGKMSNNETVSGLMYHEGFYFNSNIVANVPEGDVEIYLDADKKEKYADAYYKNNNFCGKVIFYKDNEVQKVSHYHEGKEQEVLSEIKPNTRFVGNLTFLEWLSVKLLDSEWLPSYNQTEDSYFDFDYSDEIEQFLIMVEKEIDKNFSSLSYAEEFLQALDDLKNQNLQPAGFTATLKADIYKEFITYCGLAVTTKFINLDDYDLLVKPYNEYLNKFLSERKPAEPQKPTFEQWFCEAFDNDLPSIKKLFSNDLFNTVNSRCKKDNISTAEQFIYNLCNPTTADVKKNRDKLMRKSHEELMRMYNQVNILV